jgi:hypothetical protein
VCISPRLLGLSSFPAPFVDSRLPVAPLSFSIEHTGLARAPKPTLLRQYFLFLLPPSPCAAHSASQDIFRQSASPRGARMAWSENEGLHCRAYWPFCACLG